MSLHLQPRFFTESEAVSGPQPELLHDFIAAMAASNPARTAFEDAGQTVSFFELDRQASRIANFLIGYDIGAGDIVAIHQDGSPGLFASLLGVLKTGAAYVLIDPASTPESAADIIGRSGAKMVLGSAFLPALSDLVETPIILMENQQKTFQILPGQVAFAGPRPTLDRASHISCRADGEIVSTSHEDAIGLMRTLVKFYDLGAGQRCYHERPMALDLAVEESLAMLAAGATIVLGRPANHSAEALADFVTEHRITLLSTSPEAVSGLEGDLPTLEVLILDRNPNPAKLVAAWAFRVRCLLSVKRPQTWLPESQTETEKAEGPAPLPFRKPLRRGRTNRVAHAKLAA